MRDRNLEGLLGSYVPSDARERGFVVRMQSLLRSAAPFDRGSFAPGHFTASGFVLAPERDALLLIFHKKLGLWLQPGGHVDGADADLEASARREVREETGVAELEHAFGPAIFDVDVHAIPARKDELAHEHFDVRFAFVARTRALVANDEVAGARWVDFTAVASANSDESVLRAVRKLTALLR